MKSKENPDDILSKYKVYLRLEKSLSDNTVSAYLADISKLFQFLKDEQIHPFDVTLDNLETFSANLRDLGIQPRSQARILSGIRSFYHYLTILYVTFILYILLNTQFVPLQIQYPYHLRKYVFPHRF